MMSTVTRFLSIVRHMTSPAVQGLMEGEEFWGSCLAANDYYYYYLTNNKSKLVRAKCYEPAGTNWKRSPREKKN